MNLYIVTGASRGLGLALARQLAAEPDTRVLAVSRAGVPADLAAWRNLRADLSTEAGQIGVAEAIGVALTDQRWDRAVLINNAATIEPMGVLGRMDHAVVQQAVQLNLTATIVLMNAFLVASGAVGTRIVINISSGSGRRPIAGSAVYCATKAGMDMVSRVTALEAEKAGLPVTICSLAPGIIDTDMQVAARGADESEFPEVAIFRAFKSEGRLKTPEEVARSIIAAERAGKLPNGIGDIREIA